MKKLLSILLAAVMLTACQQVPQNVKERDEELDSMHQAQSSQASDESSPVSNNQNSAAEETGDLDYIRAHLKEDAEKKYGTITVKHSSAGEGKTMPTYRREIGKDENFDLSKTAQYLYGKEFDPDNKNHFKTISGRGEPAPLVSNPFETKNDKYDIKWIYPSDSPIYDMERIEPANSDGMCGVSVQGDGRMTGRQVSEKKLEPYQHAIFEKKVKIIARYYPQHEDISGKKYKMLDGNEWSLSEAVDFVENFSNKYIAQTDSKLPYKVHSVGVSQLGDKHGFYFELTYSDENGNTFESNSYAYEHLQEDQIYQGKPFLIPQEHRIECLSKEQITYFSKSLCCKAAQKIGNNEKMLTLAAAMKKLSDKLARYIDLDFESADLCYVIECEKYPANDQIGTVGYYESYCFKTCELQIKPMWCFKEKFDESVLTGATQRAYYVDAVTGEVHVLMPGILD